VWAQVSYAYMPTNSIGDSGVARVRLFQQWLGRGFGRGVPSGTTLGIRALVQVTSAHISLTWCRGTLVLLGRSFPYRSPLRGDEEFLARVSSLHRDCALSCHDIHIELCWIESKILEENPAG
jgi:hypothetical protein